MSVSLLTQYKTALNSALGLLKDAQTGVGFDRELLREESHKLAGASMTLGYDGVGAALKILELVLSKETAREKEISRLVNNAVLSMESTLLDVTTNLETLTEGEPDTVLVDKSLSIQSILVVDDDILIRSLVASKMRQRGFDVIEATNGKEGVDKITKHRPDLVLMDGMMPVMDGFEAISKIRESKDMSLASTPVFMLTGLNDDKSRGESVKLAVDAYITKPFTVDVILDEIKKLNV